MEFNVQLQLAGLLEWMHQQMNACHGKTAVIGISGGKDSSTVAALAVAAYGKENVMGVLMPDGVQPDIDYSNGLVDVLDIPHVTINIHDAVQGVLKEMEFLIKPPSDGLSGLTDEDNLGFTYHAVNEYIRRGVVDEKIKADIDHKHAVSRFKFQTLPVYQNGLPIVLEEPTDYYNPEKK